MKRKAIKNEDQANVLHVCRRRFELLILTNFSENQE